MQVRGFHALWLNPEFQPARGCPLRRLLGRPWGKGQTPQRHILTLFLLTESDTDTQYLAYLMYDMISNESNLLRPQLVAERVFNSLHYSIQKLFKIAINRINRYSRSLINFTEKNISYEKRICLLKADDYVKSKALEKYREITSRSNNDNVSKPQLYLDGLLRIPFGIYCKEEIINYLSIFKDGISNYILSYINI